MTNIEILRMADHLSIPALARQTGIDPNRLLLLEEGRAQPDETETAALCRVFCLEPEELTGRLRCLENWDSPWRIGSWPVLSAGPDARGIVAVGIKSCGVISAGIVSRGVISLGCFTMGGFSLGMFSMGLLSIGCFSLGLASLGLICAGLIAVGNLAVGIWSFGLLAFGLGCSVAAEPLGLNPVSLELPAAIKAASFQQIYEQTPGLFRPLIACLLRLFS